MCLAGPCGPAVGGGTYTVSTVSTFNGGATSGTFTVTGTTFTSYLGGACVGSGNTVIDVAVTFTAGGQSTNEGLQFVFDTGAGSAGVFNPITGNLEFDNEAVISGMTLSC
jgi:hypothetical protein